MSDAPSFIHTGASTRDELRAFLRRLETTGWDLSLPRRLSHSAALGAAEAARALEQDLRGAGYGVSFNVEDNDYSCWRLGFQTEEAVMVTPEGLLKEPERANGIVRARGGFLGGLGGIGIEMLEGEESPFSF